MVQARDYRQSIKHRDTEVASSRQSSIFMTTSMMEARSITLYEGELSWKTGTFSKTKVFATILKQDPSLYVIDLKQLPRVNGEIPDRVNPYEEQKLNIEDQQQMQAQDKILSPGWTKFDLTNCLIFASDSDNKAFKILENRNAQGLPAKEQRFLAANVCSRTTWVKKLDLAQKNDQQQNTTTAATTTATVAEDTEERKNPADLQNKNQKEE